jgi:hypothetical protein
MSSAEVTTGWTASTYPGGRAAFYQHLRRDWTQIVAEADAAADADRARPEYAMEQWLAFERDYYDRILVGEEAA